MNGICKYLFSACCAVCATVIALTGDGLRASAQTSTANLSFKSVTITLLDPDDGFDPHHFWVHVNPEGVSYWSMSTSSLIQYAYGLESFQVIGPEWTTTDRYDIEAKFADGANTGDERSMLRALLLTRFKLKFRVEQKELEGYQLVVGKHGDKLKPSPSDPEKGVFKLSQEPGVMHFESGKMTMQELAESLKHCIGDGNQKIEDKTQKTGEYQVAFDCPRQRGQSLDIDDAGSQADSAAARSLDALGLKLEKHKFMQDVYVMSHIERPSRN